MISGIHLLEVDHRTLFRLTPSGRIERENDPDQSHGPRMWVAGCKTGNVFGVRIDVPDDIVAEIGSLVRSEPPFFDADVPPRHLERYLTLVRQGAERPSATYELIYELPHSLRSTSDVKLVTSESEEGQHLNDTLSDRGMPQGLADLGFRSVADLWPPWCAAIADGEIASLAFAARISDVGAELGLATARQFRGKGLAAAVTCGWSNLPMLGSRRLFYSTDRTNSSSQRVVARLGLRFLGASLRIS